MAATVVSVPAALLLNPHLTGSAKLLWMNRQLLTMGSSTTGSGARNPEAHGGASPVTVRMLEATSGLCRLTVRRGLARLEAAGWRRAAPAAASRASRAAEPKAVLPAALVLDRTVPHPSRVIYGILQLTPGFEGAAGQFTYTALCELTGVCRNALKQAVRALQAHGWVETEQKHKYSPIHFTLRNPAAARMKALVNALDRRVVGGEYRGETLMREYLSLLVDCDEFDDNATPGYLVNPQTGHEMQFDRYYPPGVAFEFNGPQHYGPTQKYPSVEEFLALRTRDILKHGYCSMRGMRLVVVHAEDLSIDGMRRILGGPKGLLPLRSLEGKEPLITHLEILSRTCRRRAAEDPPDEVAANLALKRVRHRE